MEKNEQLKMELDTLLEEYRTIKTEIVANLDAARQVVNLTLTAIGVLLAFTPFILQSQLHVMFLIAPLFFYVLAWSQLRYVYLGLDMGVYLSTTVIPEIHRILANMPGAKTENIGKIMSWELPGKGPTRLRPTRLLRMLFLPIGGAGYGIPLLVSVLSVVSFLILTFQSSKTITGFEIFLLVINVLAFIYSAYWGFQAEFNR